MSSQATGGIVCGTDQGTLSHFSPTPSGAQHLRKLWQLPPGGNLSGGGIAGRGITAIKHFDLTNDGVAELVAGREDGTITVSSLKTPELSHLTIDGPCFFETIEVVKIVYVCPKSKSVRGGVLTCLLLSSFSACRCDLEAILRWRKTFRSIALYFDDISQTYVVMQTELRTLQQYKTLII